MAGHMLGWSHAWLFYFIEITFNECSYVGEAAFVHPDQLFSTQEENGFCGRICWPHVNMHTNMFMYFIL